MEEFGDSFLANPARMGRTARQPMHPPPPPAANVTRRVSYANADALAAMTVESIAEEDLGMAAPAVFKAPAAKRASKRASTAWGQAKMDYRKSMATGEVSAASRALRESARFALNELSIDNDAQRKSMRPGAPGVAGVLSMSPESLIEHIASLEDMLATAGEIGQMLVEQNQNLEQEVERLTNHCAMLESESQSSQQNNSADFLHLRSEIEDLRNENDDLRGGIDELREALRQYEEENHQLREERQQNSRALAQVATLKSKSALTDELQQENDDLAGQVTELEEEIAKLKDAQRQWQQQKSKLSDEIDDLKQELNNQQQAMDSAEHLHQQQISQLRQQLHNLRARTDNTNDDDLDNNDDDNDDDDDGKKNNDEVLGNELKTALARVKLLEEENERLGDVQRKYRDQIQALESECSTLSNTLATLQTSFSNTQTDLTRTKRELTQAETEAQDAAQRAEELAKKFSEEEERRLVAERELGKLRVREEALVAQKAELDAVVEELKRQLEGDTSKEDLSRARQTIARLKAELQRANTDLDLVQTKADDAARKAQQEIEDLLARLTIVERALAEARADAIANSSNKLSATYNNDELAAVRAERDELQRRLLEAERGVENARSKQAELAKKRATRALTTQDMSGLRNTFAQVDDFRRDMELLRVQNDALRADKEKTEEELKQAQALIAELQLKRQRLEAQLIPGTPTTPSDYISQIEQLRAEVKRLQDKEKATQAELKSINEQLEQALRRIREMEADTNDSSDAHLQSELQRAREARDRAETELASAKQQFEHARAKQQRTIGNLNSTIDRLKAENQRWCDCVVAQFEYHRQILNVATAPVTSDALAPQS